jgi:hypothetical protein
MKPNLFNLPNDTTEFLKSRRQLDYDPAECEPGKVTLHPLAALTLGEVWGGTDDSSDPHYAEDGYYAIPAVSLTATCDAYDSDYILLWLPEEKKFGTWDCDHWILTVFENATWQDIEKSPAVYIGAQWNCTSIVGTRLKPWGRHPFKLGMPF